MAMDPKVKKQLMAIAALFPVFVWGIWDFGTKQFGWGKSKPPPASAAAPSTPAAPVAAATPIPAALPVVPPAAAADSSGTAAAGGTLAAAGTVTWEQQSHMVSAPWGHNFFKPYVIKKTEKKVDSEKKSDEPTWPNDLPCPTIGNINGDYAFVESSLVTKGDKVNPEITVVGLTKNSVTFRHANGGRCTSTVEGF